MDIPKRENAFETVVGHHKNLSPSYAETGRSDLDLEKRAVGQRLKSLRISRNLTQDQVAQALHMNRSTYSYHELGTTNITPKLLIWAAIFYQVSTDYLLGLEDDGMEDMGYSHIKIAIPTDLKNELTQEAQENGMTLDDLITQYASTSSKIMKKCPSFYREFAEVINAIDD